jgi:general secretion pathway protein G
MSVHGGLGRKAFTLIELLSIVVIIGVLAGIAIPKFRQVVYLAQVARAIAEVSMIGKEIDAQTTGGGSLPNNLSEIGRGALLDPWGNPYQYLPFDTKGKGPPGAARKDKFLVPINSAFDLYSTGRDGKSSPPLTAAKSRDDIVRANDGGFVGLASKY